MKALKDIFSTRELITLASIVQVGDATYRDFIESQRPVFGHPYFADTCGRIRTKFVQIQSELESHNSDFSFEFVQRKFGYGQIIPELRNRDVIIHIARSSRADYLPYASSYKIELSNNNHFIQRQLIFDMENRPPYGVAPFYALLVFGGYKDTFSVLQFPEPGYEAIIDTIELPQMYLPSETGVDENFERKKAVLKEEFIARSNEEAM